MHHPDPEVDHEGLLHEHEGEHDQGDPSEVPGGHEGGPQSTTDT